MRNIAHVQSISSTRGAALLHSFLDAVHIRSTAAPHARPQSLGSHSYPSLPEHVISSCAYRVSAGSSRRKMPLISPTPLPTPPLTPVASYASLTALKSGVGANETGSRSGSGEALKLVEKRFGVVGREARTEDVFQASFFGGGKGKGKEGGVGDVWLDGRTVRLLIMLSLLQQLRTSLGVPA